MKVHLVIIFTLLASAIQAQKKTRVIVVDSITFKPLPAVFVHVKNTSRSLLVDTTGIFTINTRRVDTLTLSHVGYKNVEIPLFFEEDAILIRMAEKVTLLKEVTVSSRKLYPNEINPRKSSAPRRANLMESIAAPWEYFNRREKEKRRLAVLMQENDRIRTFMEVITDPLIKEELMHDHDVSEATYYDLLIKFNQQKLPVIYSNDADQIIDALHDFFEKVSSDR
ncbi:MAG TPA: carboxypeptidase-like regulatory domain-containing protein [Cyclobacteriaceae bacterium]|nr:carboxypeptidase-like regulatory domain-containing protein [Cyclobacteriaceae bacterium]